jgi:SOS-response transcriptional repressor LexA
VAGKELMERGDQRRRQIYRFLQTYIKKHGWAPTVQEIADAVGLVSPNATRTHLLKLQEQGLIQIEPRGARCIRLLPQANAKITNDSTIKEAKQFLNKNRDAVCQVCGSHPEKAAAA